jgi:hypothetical protein
MKNTFISKLLTLCAVVSISTNVQAQYTGGSGRGDNKAELTTCGTVEIPTTPGSYNFTANHTDGTTVDYSSHFLSGNCLTMGSITDAAGGNTLGSTIMAMDLTGTVPTNGTGRRFVSRSVNVTPTSNGTVDMVLYFTQADFDAYNSAATFQRSLPINSADVANNKANVRVMKSATSSNETANLSLLSATVSWNASASLWQVSISGASASGYYFLTSDYLTNLMVGPMSNTPTTPLTDDNVARVLIDWADVPGATSYNIRYRLVGSPTWSAVANTAVSQVLIPGLTFAGNYEIQVQVKVNNQTLGEYSNSYNFSAPNALPVCSAPSVTNHNLISHNTVQFTWNASANGILYQIQVREKNTIFWGGTSTAALTRTFIALKGSTDYEYQVRTKCLLNATRNSWSSFSTTTKFTTPPNPPTITCLPPTNIYSTINNANSVTISWDTASNADFYSIRIQKSGDTVWGGSSTTLNSISFNSMLQNTKYYFKVRTRCLNGTTVNQTSDFTVVDSFQTPFIKSTPSLIFNDINAGWTVYPNPTQDVINVQFVSPEDADITIRISDMTGRTVKTIAASSIMGSNLIDINVAEMVNGVYTLQVIQKDKLKYVTKFNKQN